MARTKAFDFICRQSDGETAHLVGYYDGDRTTEPLAMTLTGVNIPEETLVSVRFVVQPAITTEIMNA